MTLAQGMKNNNIKLGFYIRVVNLWKLLSKVTDQLSLHMGHINQGVHLSDCRMHSNEVGNSQFLTTFVKAKMVSKLPCF